MLTVVYSTCYEQLKLRNNQVGRLLARGVTEGCVRHFVREQLPGAAGWWTPAAGGSWVVAREHLFWQQGRHSRPNAGEGYTDVVTRSAAWLTSFLLESSPLAAFMSFRKFSTVFFMFFNSPGCGVARLWSVLCKQTEGLVLPTTVSKHAARRRH